MYISRELSNQYNICTEWNVIPGCGEWGTLWKHPATLNANRIANIYTMLCCMYTLGHVYVELWIRLMIKSFV